MANAPAPVDAMAWVGKVKLLLGARGPLAVRSLMRDENPTTAARPKLVEEAPRDPLAEYEATLSTTRQRAEQHAARLLGKLDVTRKRAPSAVPAKSITSSTKHEEMVATSKSILSGVPTGKPTLDIGGMQIAMYDTSVWGTRSKEHSSTYAVNDLRKLLNELDQAVGSDAADKAVARQQRQEVDKRAKAKGTENVSFEPPPTYATWLVDKTFDSTTTTLKTKTVAERERERKAAALKLHDKQERKRSLEEEANEAKLRYGPTLFEKENEKKRTDLLTTATRNQEKQRGFHLFTRTAPRNMLSNVIAAAAQGFLVFTVLLGRDGTATLPARPSAPISIILFALAGVFGSFINLVCIAMLFAVVSAGGTEARSLPIICKVIVSCQYLSKTAQCYSLVSLLVYITVLFDRIIDGIEPGDAQSVIVALIQVACAVLLLPLLLYVFVTAHNLCFNELALLVSRETLEKSYIFNIELQQVISAVALLIFALSFYGIASEVDDTSILGFNFLFSSFCGVVCLLFSVSHYKVTTFLRNVEERSSSLNTDKELILANQRPKLIEKESFLVAYYVEKPKLVGKRGVITKNGIDSTGLVSVLIDGVEHKLQEYQMARDVPEKEQEEAQHLAELKVADLDYRLENSNSWLILFMTLYVVATQIFAGFQVVGATSILLWDGAGSIGAYANILEDGATEFNNREILRRTNLSFSGIDCVDGYTAGNLTKDQENFCVRTQSLLCDFWQRCANNESVSLNPSSCGACKVPFIESSSSSSTGTILIAGAIAGALLGTCCSCRGLNFVARGVPIKRMAFCCITMLGSFVTAALGALVAFLFFDALDSSSSSQCNAIDLDSSTSAVERLSFDCILVSGATYTEEAISQSSKGCVLASTVASAVFVLESSLLLSRKIRDLNPNAFARFEATIFFSYSLFSNAVWVGIYLADREGVLQDLFERTAKLTFQGRWLTALFGDQIDFVFDQTNDISRQKDLAEDIWMNGSVVFLVNIVLAALQVLGLYFTTCAPATSWMIGVRVIMLIDSVVIAYFVYVAYLCMIAVNITQNLIAFALIPMIIQYIFAMSYISASDIWPTEDTSSLRLLTTRLIPLMLPSVFSLGLAMYLAEEEVVGLVLLITSSCIGLSSVALFLLFGCSEAFNFFFDWLQLMHSFIFTSKAPEKQQDDDAASAIEAAPVAEDIAEEDRGDEVI